MSKAAWQEKRFQDYNERCTFHHHARVRPPPSFAGAASAQVSRAVSVVSVSSLLRSRLHIQVGMPDHFFLALTLRTSPWLLSSVKSVVETEHLTCVGGLRVVQW